MNAKVFFISILFSLSCLNSYAQTNNIKNLLKNGDFENLSFKIESDYKKSTKPTPGCYKVVKDASTFDSTFTGTGDGYFMAIKNLKASYTTIWKQTVKVDPKKWYRLSFSSTTLNNCDSLLPPRLMASINTSQEASHVNSFYFSYNCPDSAGRWSKHSSYEWNSIGSYYITIEICIVEPKKNYKDFAIDNIELVECEEPDFDTPISQAKVGDELELRKIYFDTGDFSLLPESFKQLDALANYLKNNEKVTIEIAGHTDNIGDLKSNQTLSTQRATSIANYLIQNGINKNRLKAIGYGESKPICSNETEEGRTQNRRVVIRILSM